MKLPISVIIHTKNSSQTLEKALKSASFAQEIIVIDMESQDNTIELAKKYGATIFHHQDTGYVEAARMFGISKANFAWVFVLDADEEIQPKLEKMLPQLIDGKEDAWKIPRKNLIFDKWPKHAAWWPDYVLRLFKKQLITWPNKVHSQPQLNGLVGELDPDETVAIIHHNYSSVSQYLDRINDYTTLQAKENQKYSSNSFQSFFNDFFRKYFFLEAHKDGALGLNVSLLQAIYESVLSMKKWEADGLKKYQIQPGKMIDQIMRDMSYWRADYNVRQSKGLNQLIWKVRRKLKV